VTEIMTDELEMIQKKSSCSLIEVLSWYLPGSTVENNKNSARIGAVKDFISFEQTDSPCPMNKEYYYYISP
jgi:hypothetical protein